MKPSYDSESKMNGAVRRLCVLRVLATEPCSIHRMAEMLRISVRTIQRDIADCQKAGFAITMDKETNRFNLVSDFGVPPIDLTFSEVLTIFIALQMSGIDFDPFKSDAHSASLKIASSLSPEFFDLIADNHSEIHVIKGAKDIASSGEDRMAVVMNAMGKGRVLDIRYKSPKEAEVIQTTLHLYAVFYAYRGWYVIGYAGLFNEIRTFKVIRILEQSLTKETFSRPSGFSLAHHLGNAWRLFSESGPDHEILLRFTPMVAHNVAETRWHKTQENRWLSDGSLEVRFKISGLREILFWILGYGAEVQVLDPPELKSMVYHHAKRMVEYYK